MNIFQRDYFHKVRAIYFVFKTSKKLLKIINLFSYHFTEYGGENGEIQNIITEWEKRIQSYENYYKEEDKFGVDEKLKQKHQKKCNTDTTQPASFRQLDFD